MPEQKIVLKNCDKYDPADISAFLKIGGFEALKKARSMTPEQVIDEIKQSNLRGRGGAGFPCGMKWELTRKSAGSEKYVVCNADEGEVGTFKDRHILQKDPFGLIEGIAIAGHALGATRGFIYLRGEYRYLLEQLAGALAQARKMKFLGGFDISIRLGAGAYVCGEESALMDSIEGKRGEARFKPPFPPTSGLWAKPTVINNVETLMNIPQIIWNGASWFNQIGTEKSKGTKVFSISGDVKRPGVYELVMGSSLKELVEGIAQASRVKMIQIGGATGRILPSSMLDSTLAFEGILGAGSVIVYNEDRDVIEVVYQTMEFLAEESCGKCTPCREGTQVLTGLLHKFIEGRGNERDIGALEEIGQTMSLCSLCGLGQAAPTAVTDTLRFFKEAYSSQTTKIKIGVKEC